MPETRAHDPGALQREIAERRQDLVSSLAELEGLVQRTLDVRAQLRRAADRVASDVRARPMPYVAGAGALVVYVVGRLALRRHEAKKSRASGLGAVF